MQAIIKVLLFSLFSLLSPLSIAEPQPAPQNALEAQNNVKALQDMVQLNIDAYHAYNDAIKGVDNQKLRENFAAFRDSHKKLIADLSGKLQELNAKAPSFSPDTKGYAMKFYTQIRGLTGNAGILKAMNKNESILREKCQENLALDLSQDVKDLISKNLEDENGHIAQIEEAIQENAS